MPTQRKHNLVFVVLNCQSIKNKALSLSDYVVSNKVDIFAMTENWLGSTFDDVIKQELILTSYDFLHLNRENRRGGGIPLLFRKEIDIQYFLIRIWRSINLSTWTFHYVWIKHASD